MKNRSHRRRVSLRVLQKNKASLERLTVSCPPACKAVTIAWEQPERRFSRCFREQPRIAAHHEGLEQGISASISARRFENSASLAPVLTSSVESAAPVVNAEIRCSEPLATLSLSLRLTNSIPNLWLIRTNGNRASRRATRSRAFMTCSRC